MSEAYLSGGTGLWQNGACLLSRACDGKNVSVVLAGTEQDEVTPRAEDVLAAYLTHGLGFFVHLFGPYALAIVDERTGRAVLSRDGAGRVPMLYSFAGGRLCFLSSLGNRFSVGLSELPIGGCHVFSSDGYERLRRV